MLAHQLETGGCYAVVLTTGGGLYRYQLHDLVEITGRHGACPLLRFLGKGSHISDHFGEKLNERHVQGALDTLLARFAVAAAFAMVALEGAAGGPAYTLFIETNEPSDETLRRLGLELETALQENYHYRYCRELGQLDRLRIFRIRGGGQETYLSVCQARGQRAGDIKSVALHHAAGWSRFFHGAGGAGLSVPSERGNLTRALFDRDRAVPYGKDQRLQPRLYIQLAEDINHVGARRFGADMQSIGDILVVQPVRQRLQDLALAPR